jgi:hypothetical protein
MKSKFARLMLGFAIAALPLFSMGCGTGSSTQASSGSQNGSVNMMVSDGATEDWAAINVKVLSIALNPQGGGTPVTLYSASAATAPMLNLVQLDNLSDILGTFTAPAGNYSSATLTLSANPGDVQLTASADPEVGFAAAAGAVIPSTQIAIQGASGAAGSLTVPVNVNFVSPVAVAANSTTPINLEFELSHPAFIVAHVPVGGGMTIFAVNFNGPIRHHPIPDITRLVLRHHYGSNTTVAADGSSISFDKAYPVEPPTSPETAMVTSQSLTVLVDAANGTIVYDVDGETNSTVKSFTGVSSTLSGKFVRVAARYQENGTLVAVRVWASSSFNSLWVSPEGHVLHVNTTTDVVTVEDERGFGIPLTVNANTEFFFRTPWNAVADATPIAGPGTAIPALTFLTDHDLVRGFKIHASVVNILGNPLVAQTIDIETARYDGTISAANPTDFTYTRKFNTASDDYTFTADFISNNTANGDDSNGNPMNGFIWWNFAFPTILNGGTATSGANAIASFGTATTGAVSFGGNPPITLSAYGESGAIWNDPGNPNGWAIPWVILDPTPAPLGTVAQGYSSTNTDFTMNVAGGTNAGTVVLDTVSGSATLVYQVDRTGNIVTVSPVDITSGAGVTTITDNLVSGTLVKAYGVPQANGTMKAYVVIYYTPGSVQPAD